MCWIQIYYFKIRPVLHILNKSHGTAMAKITSWRIDTPPSVAPVFVAVNELLSVGWLLMGFTSAYLKQGKCRKCSHQTWQLKKKGNNPSVMCSDSGGCNLMVLSLNITPFQRFLLSVFAFDVYLQQQPALLFIRWTTTTQKKKIGIRRIHPTPSNSTPTLTVGTTRTSIKEMSRSGRPVLKVK